MRNHSKAGITISSLIAAIGMIILSGGATNSISQILTLVLTGLILLVRPPRFLPGNWIVGSIFAFVLWVLISTFVELPFGSGRAWVIQRIPDLQVGPTGSVQPLLSLEKFGFLSVGIFWLLVVLANPLTHRERTVRMRWLVWFILGCSLVVIVGIVLKIQHPFSWGTHRFSFFPNHNQNGVVLAIGGILCSGLIVRSLRRKSWTALIYFIGLGVVCLALFMGMSRSAILIAGAGCGIFLLATYEKKNSGIFVKLGVPVLILLIAAFALYGNHLIKEFTLLMSKGGIQEELRILIYLDAFNLFKTFPIMGVGLGNFRYFFPNFREQVGLSVTPIHPESDMVWVGCELGVIGLLILFLVLIILIVRLDVRSMIKNRGTRLCAFVALALFIFGSLIEVSGHRLGTALLAILVYGIAQPENAKLRKSALLPVLAQIAGLGFLILAGFWGYRFSQGIPFTVNEVIQFSREPHGDLVENVGDEETLQQMVLPLVERYPMMTTLMEHRAIGILRLEEDVDQANLFFKNAQLIRPKEWEQCIRHGIHLFPYDFELALTHWIEAMDRANGRERKVLSDILRFVPAEHYSRLGDLAFDNPELQFIYYSRMRYQTREFSRALGLELAINPGLDGLSSDYKQTLLWHYSKHNGATVLRRLFNIHPELGVENWSLKALLAASERNFKEASRLTIMNFPEPEMIDLTRKRTYTSIYSEYQHDLNDPLKLIALVQKHKENGSYLKAAAAIELGKERGINHEYLNYQLALMHFYLGHYEKAWNLYQGMIESTLQWAPYLIE